MFILLDFALSGILNHEELSLLNKGLKKSEMGMLPQIEELGISSESNRSIESDASCCTNIQKAFCKYNIFRSKNYTCN